MKMLYDELDERFDDDDISIFNNWFDKQQYVVCGTAQTWLGRGSGYMPYVYDSVAEAIGRTADDWGICYVKIYEEKYGKLCFDISHHDGYNEFEIREITDLGKEILNNTFNDVGSIINRKGATRNVKWCKRH